jgi:bifunctional NMN adenylyltransferase/nudix hydrolase
MPKLNTSAAPRVDVAVIIGRWQLAHRGHETLRRTALALAPKVIIVLGSAWHSRDPRHPFTAHERQQMIEAVLTPEERARVIFLPVRDYYDNDRWQAAVRAGVAAHTERTDHISLVGFKKPDTGYLDIFPGWALHEVTLAHDISATDLRRVYFETENLTTALNLIGNYAEPGIVQYLEAWAKLPVYRQCAAEHKAVVEYRIKWPAPYYLTADSVLQFQDHILLVKRKDVIGNNLYALPGGFCDPDEQFYSAAVRELGEETNYRPLASRLQAALKGKAVFEHAQRSPRGRLVTMVFHFDFGHLAFPEVRPQNSEIKSLEWVHKSKLASIEADLFEDHACIIDQFMPFFDQP